MNNYANESIIMLFGNSALNYKKYQYECVKTYP